MNSFLFLQSTRLSYWQNILSNCPSPINSIFKNQDTLIFCTKLNEENYPDLTIINSPLRELAPKELTTNIKNGNTTSLIGNECAFLNYNLDDKVITIARDFPGSETIYYYLTNQEIIISDNFFNFKSLELTKKLSELKTLEYLSGTFINNNLTLWDKINKVRPGEIIKFKDYQIISKTKIKPKDLLDIENSSHTFAEILSNNWNPKIQRFNCELSGGLDSTTIVDSICKNVNPTKLKTYSILFPEFICNEKNEINNFLKIRPHDNHQINYQTLSLEELNKLTQKISYFPDYPNSLSALVYLESMELNEEQVLIDGFGGDQLFGLWKTKNNFGFLDRLKSKLLNDLKLRGLFKKRLFPWLDLSFECKLLTHLNSNHEDYPKNIALDQLAMIQQLFSADFSEYLESACLIAKAHQVYRSHPYLRKEMIAFALNLNISERTHKTFLRNELNKSLGLSWQSAKKVDFIETFKAYSKQLDYQEFQKKAYNQFTKWLDPESSLNISHLIPDQSKQLSFNWNLIGLLMIEEKNL